jgi:hypothetical protein
MKSRKLGQQFAQSLLSDRAASSHRRERGLQILLPSTATQYNKSTYRRVPASFGFTLLVAVFDFCNVSRLLAPTSTGKE